MHSIGYNHGYFVDDSLETVKGSSSSDSNEIVEMEKAIHDSDEGYISLAYERLHHIPRHIATNFRHYLHLDLSYNFIKDLSFLTSFNNLKTLILDRNPVPDDRSLPLLPKLELLWLNHCGICRLSNWIRKISNQCPNLKYLSLMGNPGVSSTFSGNSPLEHEDYRLFVISQLKSLTHLDDTVVSKSERAKANLHLYSWSWTLEACNIFESYGVEVPLKRQKFFWTEPDEDVEKGDEPEKVYSASF